MSLAQDPSTWTARVAIVCALLVAYLPALILPYYFVDDVWLYRRPEPGLPDVVNVVMFQQGRPVFGALALLMQVLRARIGLDAVLIARSLAVVAAGTFAFCAYRFIRLWHTPLIALCLVILLITLPSLQMYVTAAPLFAPSLAYCGLVSMLFGRVASREHNTRLQWVILLSAVTGLLFVWATYQALPLIVIGLLTPMLLSESWRSNPRWRRVGAFVVAVGGSLALYYLLWRLANVGLPSDNRYSPASVGFHAAENLPRYLARRLPQMFGFWDSRAKGHIYVYECLALIAVGFAIDVRRSRVNRYSRVAAWAFAAGAIVAVDSFLFFVPSVNSFSYMTSGPSAVATLLLGGMAVKVLIDAIVTMMPTIRLAGKWSALLVCSAAIVVAGRNALVHQVLPNWLEYALVRSELRRQMVGAPITAVTVFQRTPLNTVGRDEFGWSNFSGSFWIHWAVRDILDELRVDSRVYIEVINLDGSKSVFKGSDDSEAVTPPESGRHVTVDLRGIDLAAPGNGPSQPPPFWETPSAGGSLRPPGLVIVPISGIDSTLTYAQQGAGGERSAIDGNVSTEAADPNGFNPRTSITLSLGNVADVSGVRIVSAHSFGIQVAGMLTVACENGAALGLAGTLVLVPGSERVSETYWSKPCHTRRIRLEAVGVAAGTNFWIAEIQVLGTPAS